MKWSTEVGLVDLPEKITYDSQLLALGSCFAVNMADAFKNYQFRNVINPFGILFHPVALGNLFEFAAQNKVFEPDSVFCNQDVWSCFDAHSDLNALDELDILLALNQKLQLFKQTLQSASHVIITLGTAWVYRHIESGKLVANCHKLPQKLFVKELLTADEITKSLQRMQELALQINPKVQFIFTISPVRHIKDGVVENQRSKSNLFVGLHQFLDLNKKAYYFPTYEIMMDELRDYRFYGRDLLHPNEMAITYIWEKFKKHCIAETAYPTMQLVDEVQKGLAHRPFNPHSEQHELFLNKLAQKLDVLLEQYPFMNFR
ncbi:GSCFA domain-containing protein [Flavobacterium agricola]|uniref:GSCFA domain-containing protein n=1 Tax=Flavobacterium agricola TaxID=2870839 RepID=A0ABY6M081_9FLAO|nr:GSCFA domain-containing protein [Flavobacterium agricola]UYW00583.1 GSCFA domain-containing protein [Flavobacterium agricola]